MEYSIPQFLLLGALTFIFVGVLTPLMRKIALKVGAVDAPNLARKSQKEPVPYLGGVAIAGTRTKLAKRKVSIEKSTASKDP